MSHKLTDLEYLGQLKMQLGFLQADLDRYELGQKDFAIRIAVVLRTIFHNTNSSKAILPDLAERNGVSIYFRGKNSQIDSYVVLYIGFTVGNKKPLFDAPFLVDKSFIDYWEEIVYLEGKIKYTRKQLVLWAANKLGGAHVDPEIPNELFRLVDGSTKLISNKYGEETIMNQVVYEMALQARSKLEQLIPELEKRIKN